MNGRVIDLNVPRKNGSSANRITWPDPTDSSIRYAVPDKSRSVLPSQTNPDTVRGRVGLASKTIALAPSFEYLKKYPLASRTGSSFCSSPYVRYVVLSTVARIIEPGRATGTLFASADG